jgi:hypothetical protein
MHIRFSIRDILLLTAVVGLIIGWTLDRTQLNIRYQANTASLKTVLGRVHAYDTQIQPRLNTLSEKYRSQDRVDDVNYYRRECGNLEMELDRAREVFALLLRPMTATEIK